jgi:hypothetical protein
MALNEHEGGTPERDARLDRLYAHAGREEPPARLDAAIQAAARRAVGARPQPVGARLRRWGVPISIAAVVVVSVSLVTLMREQGAGRLDESSLPAPAEPKAAAPAEPEQAQQTARDRVEPGGRAEVASPQVPPAPAERAGAASSADTRLRARGLAEPGEAPPRAAEESGSGLAPRTLGEADRAATREAAPGAEMMGKKRTEAPAAEAPAAPPPAALRSAPARADQDPLAAPALETSERSLADDRLKSLIKELENKPPESWLERVEGLRREGQQADADALLVEFKKRFPGHPVTHQDIERVR